MRRSLVLTVCVLASGCELGYEEIREGRAATVYACGDNWPDFLVDDIVAAIDDWNIKVGPRFGQDLFVFGGVAEGERTFESSDTGDGRHCIYRVTPETATADTQNLERGDPKAAALFVDNDDIVIWSNLSGDRLERWMLQRTVAHELGHGAGLDHVDDDDPMPSVMKPKRHSGTVQPLDIENFCDLGFCRS